HGRRARCVLPADPDGRAADREPGDIGIAALAAIGGGGEHTGGDCHRASPRRGATEPDRGGAPGRTAEVRADRFDYPRFSNAADVDEGGGDQPAEFATL